MSNFVHLENRGLIFVNGVDHLVFLQGLISQDVNKVLTGGAVYSLMVNPQARFLYEFFITKYKDGVILEVEKDVCESLIKKLSFYKLRSDVNISKIEDLEVFFVDDVDVQISDEINFVDPRKEGFGVRIYVAKDQFLKIAAVHNLKTQNLNYYHYLRFQNRIIDENDLTFDKSIIVEYGFDDLNAIDYKKGCYVGQEVVARTHYRGQIRKEVFLIEIENMKEIAKDSEITCDGKKQGIILSSLFYENKLYALSLIKNYDISGNKIDISSLNLEVFGHKIKIYELRR